MAYNKFTLKKVQTQFNLTMETSLPLFRQVPPIEPNARLIKLLDDFVPIAVAIDTEKSRSEWIVAPILGELRLELASKMSIFSGINFEVDRKQQLTGFCDFLISQSPNQLTLTAPVVAIAEAKKDNIKAGLGQAIATMIAAQIFNEREGNPLEVIYGVSTTGTTWKFLNLIGQTVSVDSDEYHISNLNKIMGILTYMVTNKA